MIAASTGPAAIRVTRVTMTAAIVAPICGIRSSRPDDQREHHRRGRADDHRGHADDGAGDDRDHDVADQRERDGVADLAEDALEAGRVPRVHQLGPRLRQLRLGEQPEQRQEGERDELEDAAEGARGRAEQVDRRFGEVLRGVGGHALELLERVRALVDVLEHAAVLRLVDVGGEVVDEAADRAHTGFAGPDDDPEHDERDAPRTAAAPPCRGPSRAARARSRAGRGRG